MEKWYSFLTTVVKMAIPSAISAILHPEAIANVAIGHAPVVYSIPPIALNA
jgi:hypothetical protein